MSGAAAAAQTGQTNSAEHRRTRKQTQTQTNHTGSHTYIAVCTLPSCLLPLSLSLSCCSPLPRPSPSGNPLVLQSRPSGESAPEKFPQRDLPRPLELQQSDKELVERSRFLSETMKYSGYYVVPDPTKPHAALLAAHRFTSTEGLSNGPIACQQVYTPTFERYSDRYRKILGKKTFHSEILQPNTHLFPQELISDKHGRLVRPTSTTTFTSKVQFLSTKTLLSEVTRLVTARTPLPGTSGEDGIDMQVDPTGSGENGEERKIGEGEEDEEDENQEMEEEVHAHSHTHAHTYARTRHASLLFPL